MVNRSLLNMQALVRVALLANIPWYLFKHFRAEETVKALARSYTAKELLAEIIEVNDKLGGTIEDQAVACAALIALSFRPAQEVREALPSLQGLNRIRWAPELTALVLESLQNATGVTVLSSQPTIKVVSFDSPSEDERDGKIIRMTGATP